MLSQPQKGGVRGGKNDEAELWNRRGPAALENRLRDPDRQRQPCWQWRSSIPDAYPGTWTGSPDDCVGARPSLGARRRRWADRDPALDWTPLVSLRQGCASSVDHRRVGGQPTLSAAAGSHP